MGKRMSPARPSVAGLCEAASLCHAGCPASRALMMTAADDDATVLCPVLEAQNSSLLAYRQSIIVASSRHCVHRLSSPLRPNASEGRRLSQVGLVSSVSLCTWNELVRL